MTNGSPLDNPILTEHAAEIRRLGKRVVENVIEIGGRLSECRAILKEDGSWRAWLESELRLSPQTAGRFIQVHEMSQGRSNLEHLDLPVSALYLLAAPSTPQEARDTIIERAQAGESVSVDDTKRAIKDAKGRKRLASKALAKPHQRRRESADPPKQQTVGEQVDDDIGLGRDRAHDDVGPDSAGEIARKDARIEELENAKRQLEIEVAGLESKLEEAKAAAKPPPGSKPASRCSICHEKKQAVLRPVFICDNCVDIHEVREAAPPDDGLDIPESLRREPAR